MKNIKKVISDRIHKIEINNLKVIEYKSMYPMRHDEVTCQCNKCKHMIKDSHINLAYKNFICKYCELMSASDLVKNGDVKIINIDGKIIELECKKGHVYKQDRRNLLSGKYCNKCYLDNKVFSKDKIINKFRDIHGDYYKYNFNDFKNLHSKIEITCKKGHVFSQKVSNHLQGKGCPICRESLGERTISNYLKSNDIDFIRQKKFDDCIHICRLPFDFYLPKLNLAIEYDGIQHFMPIKQFGGEIEFEKVKIKDKIKTEYCKNNNIKLLRISYKDDIIKSLIDKLIIFKC